MFIDFSKEIIQPNGENVYADTEETKKLTLGGTAISGLNLKDPGKKEPLTGQDRYDIGNIIAKLTAKGKAKVDIDINELATIKKHIGFIDSPLIIKIAWDMLENKDKKE